MEASLRLQVKPHVAADKSVIMEVLASNNEPVSLVVNQPPSISKKEAKTRILVKDGETAVIGGIFKITKSNPATQTPFLAKLPVVGALFREKLVTERNDKLLIFLTPRIIESGAPTIAGGI